MKQLEITRRKKHLSLRALSALSGVHYTVISKIERGEVRCTYESAGALSRALKCSRKSLYEPRRFKG